MKMLKAAFVYGVPAGLGGLGLESANTLAALAQMSQVHALGPGYVPGWPLPLDNASLSWSVAPAMVTAWRQRYTPFRWRHGDLQEKQDTRLGLWAMKQASQLAPDFCYAFTQVGLETLRWARRQGLKTFLENPNGDLRHFAAANHQEAQMWCHQKYVGHPNQAMIERVVEEYALAEEIRVSSEWAKRSMVEYGAPAEKIKVIPQPVNLQRFCPPRQRQPPAGPLRLVFVGSLSLVKGFAYLLQAVKKLGADRFSVELVGGTGTRCCAQLLAKTRQGLTVKAAPGDPLPAYQAAEVFVLPTLDDGFGFVVAEAMACGLPVIVTKDCGAAELVVEGESGWIIESGSIEAVAVALERAWKQREHLAEMGRKARLAVENKAGASCLTAVREWVYGLVANNSA